MPRWTLEQLQEFQRRETKNRNGIRSPKLEQASGDESVRPDEGEKKMPGKIVVHITSRRKRLLDPDNLSVKSLLDSLRYAGIVPGDRAKDILLQVEQVQVHGDDPGGTVIEIEYPDGQVINP